MEDHQRSLADFLIKTSFALLTALGGLTALLTGLVGGLEINRDPATIILIWASVALLLAATVFSGRVMSLPRGSASDGARGLALRRARGTFVAALCVLMISPAGSALRLLSPGNTVALAFSGAKENRIEVTREHRAHVGLTVRNSGPRLQSYVNVVAPIDAGITVTPSAGELTLEPNAIGVIGISLRVDSTVQLGSYPLVVHLTSDGRILAAASVELVLTDQRTKP